MKNSFGANLSAIRNNAGLSQSALAEQLSVSRQAVSSWERDLSEPDISSIERIAEALDVSVSDLIDGSEGKGTEADIKISPIFLIVIHPFLWLLILPAFPSVMFSEPWQWWR